MVALLDNTAVRHDNNIMGVLDGGEAMSNGNGGAALRRSLKRGLYDAFRFGVKRRGSLVKEKN